MKYTSIVLLCDFFEHDKKNHEKVTDDIFNIYSQSLDLEHLLSLRPDEGGGGVVPPALLHLLTGSTEHP